MNHFYKILFILFILNATLGIGQINLVPNGSFEDTVGCPFGSFEINKAVSWSSAGGSPDYFHSCASAGGASVPDNFMGYQNASDGEAYVGLYTYNKGVLWPNNREHIQTNLISPLVIGTKYYISMDISFTIDLFEVGFAANKLGVLFTNTTSYNSGNPPPINNNSQIFIDTIISDTIGWYHIEKSFVADSAYQKILIGNFFDDISTDTLNIDTSKFTAYYFIDNVCVSSDSNTCLVSTSINESFIGNNIILFPNPTSDGAIWIEIKNYSKSLDVNYNIFNSIGEMTLSNFYIIQQNRFKINLATLSKGVYYIILQINSETITKKIIIN